VQQLRGLGKQLVPGVIRGPYTRSADGDGSTGADKARVVGCKMRIRVDNLHGVEGHLHDLSHHFLRGVALCHTGLADAAFDGHIAEHVQFDEGLSGIFTDIRIAMYAHTYTDRLIPYDGGGDLPALPLVLPAEFSGGFLHAGHVIDRFDVPPFEIAPDITVALGHKVLFEDLHRIEARFACDAADERNQGAF